MTESIQCTRVCIRHVCVAQTGVFAAGQTGMLQRTAHGEAIATYVPDNKTACPTQCSLHAVHDVHDFHGSSLTPEREHEPRPVAALLSCLSMPCAAPQCLHLGPSVPPTRTQHPAPARCLQLAGHACGGVLSAPPRVHRGPRAGPETRSSLLCSMGTVSRAISKGEYQ